MSCWNSDSDTGTFRNSDISSFEIQTGDMDNPPYRALSSDPIRTDYSNYVKIPAPTHRCPRMTVLLFFLVALHKVWSEIPRGSGDWEWLVLKLREKIPSHGWGVGARVGHHRNQIASLLVRHSKFFLPLEKLPSKMNIESWCTVERNSKQDSLRANRRHYNHAFSSSVFKAHDSKQHLESRLSFNSTPNTHKERRHFPEKCEYSFIWWMVRMVSPLRQVRSSLRLKFAGQ